MRFSAIPVFFILFSVAAHTQPDRVSLERLKAETDRHIESIRIQQLNMAQSRLATESLARTRLPKIDLTASYTHVSEVGKIQLKIPGLPITAPEIQFGDGNVYETSLNLSVPLFTGFKLATAVEMQRFLEEIASQTADGTLLEAHTFVTAQYRAAQLARSAADIFDAQLVYLKETLRSRKALYQQGQTLAIDTLVLSTRMAQLLVDRAKAMSQYDKAVLQLMQASGRDAVFDVESQVPSVSTITNLSARELQELAWANRYELKNLETSKQLADLSVKSAEASYYPSVYAQGALKYARPGVDQFRNEWMDYYVIGARLEWNLWSWGSDQKNVERLSLEREKTELKQQQLKAALKTQIGTTRNELAVLKQTLSVLELQIGQEQLKQSLIDARYREGLATASDVVDAETSLTTALLRREQTRIEFAMKGVELAAIVGVEPE